MKTKMKTRGKWGTRAERLVLEEELETAIFRATLPGNGHVF